MIAGPSPFAEGAPLATLIHLSYSPWSEKARWALDHHHLQVKRVHYTPMLGEPGLRLRLGRLRGKVTVPVLIDGRDRIEDSLGIARWAEAHGQDAPLFPEKEHERLEEFVACSERIMALGRERATAVVSANPEALRESVPAPLNRVGPVARVVGFFGVRYLRRKYVLSANAPERIEEQMRPLLTQVRDALAERPYLLTDFSFADIAVAAALQFVSPVSGRYIRLGTASRAAWTSAPLAEGFRGLLDWRDELYEDRR